MADSKEQEQHLQASAEEHQMPRQTKVNSARKRCSMNAITLFVASLALLVSGYGFFSNTKAEHDAIKENKTAHSVLTTLMKQQRDIAEEQKSQTLALNQLTQRTNEDIVALNNEVDSVRHQPTNKNQEWLLLTVRYYLELAQINAHWSDSTKATVNLLEQADLILAQLNTPQVFKIRQIIAMELVELNAIHPTDVPGLLSQLDAMQHQVTQLNDQPILSTPDEYPHQAPTSSVNPDWKERLQESLTRFSSFVVIRHHDEDIKPLLSPQLAFILKESIHLNIQQAQWAILNKNTQTYQWALKQAITTLVKNFNSQLTNTQTLLKQLTQLQNLRISQEQPQVGGALPLINQLLEQKQPVQPDTQSNKAEEQAS